jgi:hypothetical protein
MSSHGGSNALDKEIKMLEAKLGVSNRDFKKGTDFMGDIATDGLGEIFCFLDSLSMFNGKGNPNKKLKVEGDDLTDLHNFDYNLQGESNSEPQEFGDAHEDSDSADLETTHPQIDLSKKPAQSILKKPPQPLPEAPKPTPPTLMTDATEKRYKELLTVQFTSSPSLASLKTARTFCNDVDKTINQLSKNNTQLLTIIQDLIITLLMNFSHPQLALENTPNLTKMFIFTYYLKHNLLSNKKYASP